MNMSDKEKTEETAEQAPAPEAAEGAACEAAEEAAAQEETQSAPAGEADEIEKLEDEIAAEKDRNIRLLADFDNFRRRVTREKNETYQRAAESTITEFLPVLDNFDRAIAQAPEAGDAFADGVRMVYGQLSEVLAKAGVKPVEALGAAFNPEEHEAIAYQPSPDAPEGQVIYEAKRGYRMGDRVIRPASVIVSSGAPQAAEAAPAAEAPAPAAAAQEE